MVADKCAFHAITPDDLLRDRIIFGIADNKVRERLLREPELNLAKTLNICRASEMSQAQVKVVSEFSPSNVHLLKENKKSSEGKSAASDGQPYPTSLSFVSGVGSMKVNVRPALLGANSVSSAAKRTIFQGNAPFLPRSASNKVSLLEEEDQLPVFKVTNQSSDSSLVTLKVLSGNFIRFEIDTGARCNVLLMHIYKKATGNFELKHVTPAKSSIVSYDGGNIPVLGTAKLQVWRGSFTCLLLCRLVESKRCRPVLGKLACEGMGVVEVKDSDAIRRCRMPFDISSAPDVFQHRMHELIEGLGGTEVVADDFVVAGFGDSLEEASRDHNKKPCCISSTMFHTWYQARSEKTSAVLGGGSLNWPLRHQVWSENSSCESTSCP